MNKLECENCEYENDCSVYGPNDFKEVYTSSDRCHRTYAICRRCNQYSVLLKTKCRFSNNGIIKGIVEKLQTK